MQPGERIDVVKRVAERLAAEDEWTEIDFILEQFGFPTSVTWSGNKRSYLIEHLKDGDGNQLAAIDQYLMGHARPGEDPWEDSAFRLFLTHIAIKKQIAHALKSCLRFYGIDAFVAHEDIEPGREWQIVIESALNSCDALAGLLHEGFRESDWCDQEVGIAIGRGIVVIPIRFDLLPYGFFGSVQAIPNGADRDPKNLARGITSVSDHSGSDFERNDSDEREHIVQDVLDKSDLSLHGLVSMALARRDVLAEFVQDPSDPRFGLPINVTPQRGVQSQLPREA